MSVDVEQMLADASAAKLSGAARTASDELLIIDPETRQIAVPENFLLGVESDQNVERVRFQCPKIVGDNIDLSKLHIYVNYQNANQEVSSYWCQDVEVEGDNITFSWLISRAATMYQGETIFIVCAKKSDEEGNLTNEWNTTIPEHGGIVLEGLEPDPRLEQQYPDVIEQILTELDTIKAGGGGSGTPGKDGREIEIQNNGTAIQWRYVGESEWKDLVQLSDLMPEAQNGVPSGGTTGQVLSKKSDSDYDVEWKDSINSEITNGSITPEKTDFMVLKEEGEGANLLDPSLLVSFGYYNSEGEFDKSGELNGTNGGYRYIFTKSNGNLEFKNIYVTSSVDYQNANKCVKDKGKLNVNAGTTYCFQADKVISNSYQNKSASYLLLYKIDGSFVKSINFASSKEYITCVFTPDEDGYILVVLGEAASENEKTVNAYKNYMLSKNSGYVQYEEYGVSTNQTLDIAEKYKEGFVKNLSGIDLSSNNNFVCFSDCEYEDTDGILEESKEHMKNSKSTLKMSTIQTGTEYSITFKNIGIEIDDSNFGIWFWISRLDKGCTQGASTSTNTYATVKIKINSDYEHTYTKSALKSGMNYYLIDSSNVPSKKISTVTITLSAASNGQNVSIYLDSIEKGYKTIPHVLLNMDCSPKQLISDKGYELLTKYGLTATFDYHSFPSGGNSGTWDDETEAKTHMKLIAEGFDYGIYSQYKADLETTGQPQYYDTDYDKWYAHAVTMYKSNNILGIFAPTTVHSNFHYAGDAYERAMVDAGFLIVRTDNIMWDNAGSYKDCLFSYFDKDDYREIVPYWLQGAYTEDDNVAKAKELIDLAISRGQNVMICCHSIKNSEYDGSSDNTNVGENAIDPLFAYIKEKVDAGEIKCSTSADFIRDVAPDLYSWWNNKKNDLQYNYVINKIVT